jgi:hypothetical protein
MKKIIVTIAMSLFCFSYAHAYDFYCATYENKGAHYAHVISVDKDHPMCVNKSCGFHFTMHGGSVSAPPNASDNPNKYAAWWVNVCSTFAQTGPEGAELKGNLNVESGIGFNKQGTTRMTFTFNKDGNKTPFSFTKSSYFNERFTTSDSGMLGAWITATLDVGTPQEVVFYKYATL